jgi:hypothetical protein
MWTLYLDALMPWLLQMGARLETPNFRLLNRPGRYEATKESN